MNEGIFSTEGKSQEKSAGSVRSVERAADILTCMGSGEKTLTEISVELGLSKATVYRILGALRNKNFVSRDADSGKYYLHWGLTGLLNAGLEQGVVQSVYPLMEKLWRLTGETVTLYIKKGYNRICVAEIVSQQPLKFAVGVGTVVPINANTGSPGKVFLAYMNRHEVDEFLNHEHASQGFKPTGQGLLLKELEEIRKRGWAVSYGERIKGGSSLSVPVWDRSGDVVASLNLLGPYVRLNEEVLLGYLDLLKECAEAASIRLGGSPAKFWEVNPD
ncbi:transcriptional regulator, IclR family [Desulfotomaculum arcticum]|uniref:Transcriptional regulator, IclR family n=1 Tax=Desulfotruncus arcticus DSM 17038 TaxID=1121424 RepID=A0A1I2WWX9_9FIRM|nr:IclR family transcriptional regulator [Desulfotruncus arcticus]SFH05844.1 transcriptional regulator, IclR family [Desulfotomaculum arcticum] [Desulfotruncus arcticus DSM 17038]